MAKSHSQHHRRKPKPMDNFKSLDEFVIKEELGKGGYSYVHLAEHKDTGKQYALKCGFRTKNGKDRSKRTYMEIKVLQKLNHKHIIKLHGWFEDADNIYLVLELVPHKDIKKFFMGKTPDKSLVKRIISQLVETLIYIHKKRVIHRDLKLENILIDDNLNIKLIDFGLCAVKKDKYDMFDSMLGTLRYTSPEMIGDDKYNESVDCWSVGIILFKLLTGSYPFNGEDKEAIFKRIKYRKIKWYKYNLERDEISLIRKLLKKDPEDRIELEYVLDHHFFRGI